MLLSVKRSVSTHRELPSPCQPLSLPSKSFRAHPALFSPRQRPVPARERASTSRSSVTASFCQYDTHLRPFSSVTFSLSGFPAPFTHQRSVSVFGTQRSPPKSSAQSANDALCQTGPPALFCQNLRRVLLQKEADLTEPLNSHKVASMSFRKALEMKR